MRIMGNLRKAGNLLEKKSFIVTVIVLNCIVISLLTGYLFFLKEKNHSVNKPAVATEEKQVHYSDKDAEMADIYASLLEGAKFDLGDGLVFSFGPEGIYAGFFDADNRNVKDYRYNINMEGDNIFLNIYNKEETRLVSYDMSFDKNGDMLLRHPDMKETIKLKF
ncbi:MAG: hypothetical protein HFH72_02550 [Lachnospiraceae bacterium]|nr:hypothetical protein [Lachnospiraceae bacterium]